MQVRRLNERLATRGWALGTLLLVLLFMLAWTWGTWPDVLIDFGRELYVAWRLAEGNALYKDVAYFNGPLSPYFNSLIFRILGTSILSLVIVNTLLLVLALVVIYNLMRIMSNSGTAFLSTLLFVLLFSSIQLTGVGNYNFLAPYSHEMTHGFLLAMGSLYAYAHFQEEQSTRWVFVIGVLVGLTFLTKPELFAAQVIAISLGLILEYREREIIHPSTEAGVAVLVSAFAGGALLPIGSAILLLAMELSIVDALRGATSAIRHVFNPNVWGQGFYRDSMGMTDPRGNIFSSVKIFALWSVLMGTLVAIAVLVRRTNLNSLLCATAVFVVVLLGLLLAPGARSTLLDFGAMLTIFSVSTFGALMYAGISPRYRLLRDSHWRLAIVFAAFALCMLSKMVLNPRIFHYGFVLALPATLLVSLVALDWLPRAVRHLKLDIRVYRGGVLATLVALVVVHLSVASSWIVAKQNLVSDGRDAFLADDRGRVVAAALSELEGRLADEDTLAVLPLGATINYLLRHANSTPFVTLLPLEYSLFGETAITAAYRSSPPKYILVLAVDTSAMGQGTFGEGYGADVWSLIQTHYRSVRHWRDTAQPMMLLQRLE